MKQYAIDEFIRNDFNDNPNDAVDKKIALLYDFCILKTRSRQAMDSREPQVRKMLIDCGSEHRMTALLHDVLVGNKTLDQLITQRSMMTV